ncbi:MAG: helix-turn-helix domain-containing protein [Nanoarchaeota archaeon]
METSQVLRELGFTENEVRVYLTLLDKGSLKAGSIAQLVHMNRGSCYHSLKQLMERGIVSHTWIGKIQWFQPIEPERLLDYVKEKEENIRRVLPELQARYKELPKTGRIKLFRGKRGIQTMLLDLLDKGRIVRAFGQENILVKTLPHFIPSFAKKKIEKGIKTKLILGHPKEKKMMKKGANTEVRFFPMRIESPVNFSVYADRVLLMVLGDEPEGVMIENVDAAKAYKQIFDFMWENAKKKP